MWRTPRRNVNAGWSDSQTTYSGLDGTVVYGPYPITQPGWVEKYGALYSEDNAKVNGDKRCEHYVRTKQIHHAPLPYGRFGPAPSYWEKWVLPSTSIYGYTGGVKDISLGSADDPNLGLPLLFSGGDGPTLPSDGSRKVLVDLPSVTSLVDDSLSAMLPGIRPRMSLLNSIWELSDLGMMARQIRRVGRSVQRFTQILRDRCPWYRADQLRRRLTLRNITRTAADGYLSWMFGYKPMYDDLMALMAITRSYREQVRKLLADEGKEKTLHFQQDLSDLYVNKDESRTTVIGNGCNGKYRDRRLVTYVNPMFRASIRYSYELPDWAKEDAYLRGWLDALGVNVNPRVVWAAIPYSFVLDWVLGIGRWLDQFKERNLEPKTHIHRYCISYEVQRSIVLTTQVIDDSVTGLNTGEVPVATMNEQAYVRMPYSPPWLRSLQVSGLSLTELSLGSALVVTRSS